MGLPRKWKTRDGRNLWIKDMTTQHIENTLGMYERMSEELVPVGGVWDIDDIEFDYIDYTDSPIFEALEKEYKKRLDKSK